MNSIERTGEVVVHHLDQTLDKVPSVVLPVAAVSATAGELIQTYAQQPAAAEQVGVMGQALELIGSAPDAKALGVGLAAAGFLAVSRAAIVRGRERLVPKSQIMAQQIIGGEAAVKPLAMRALKRVGVLAASTAFGYHLYKSGQPASAEIDLAGSATFIGLAYFANRSFN